MFKEISNLCKLKLPAKGNMSFDENSNSIRTLIHSQTLPVLRNKLTRKEIISLSNKKLVKNNENDNSFTNFLLSKYGKDEQTIDDKNEKESNIKKDPYVTLKDLFYSLINHDLSTDISRDWLNVFFDNSTDLIEKNPGKITNEIKILMKNGFSLIALSIITCYEIAKQKLVDNKNDKPIKEMIQQSKVLFDIIYNYNENNSNSPNVLRIQCKNLIDNENEIIKKYFPNENDYIPIAFKSIRNITIPDLKKIYLVKTLNVNPPQTTQNIHYTQEISRYSPQKQIPQHPAQLQQEITQNPKIKKNSFHRLQSFQQTQSIVIEEVQEVPQPISPQASRKKSEKLQHEIQLIKLTQLQQDKATPQVQRSQYSVNPAVNGGGKFNNNAVVQENKNNYVNKYKFLIPFPPTKPLTLVLDMDETLVNVNQETSVITYRPGLRAFLNNLMPYYELIVFTTSLQPYADEIINGIEENKKFFSYRLYRQHAHFLNNKFIKNLSKLGRDLLKTIIVDDKSISFELQRENGILIKPFYAEPNDYILYDLERILIRIAKEENGDVRESLRRYRSEIDNKVSN